ncbi:uracil-DNA glycosylase [Altererythrobacter aerius]|uniref:Uracil-DNA glycosylase n=1 Tax=Tsuneonella aeria TaxID=1837929 RepID=A0A6I4TE96_9SPHN|nr:uracil-DNA glycosylase [Tsuneonella aeria]MXO75552.1 uracil-DNA glycosylase [Tsuneonella aeria]
MDADNLPPGWRQALGPAMAAPALHDLIAWLDAEEAAGKAIFPPGDCRLRAFALTPLDAVRVVILGQDPYHGIGQAMGLCFAVPEGVAVPPSLANIYRELESDCGIPRPGHGDLQAWARQGVLLLNTALTVEAGKAGSHAGLGWEALTDAAIAAVAARPEPTVFILWGAHAQAKADRVAGVSDGRHLVIRSPHPSPLSAYRGFFGSRPFSRANTFLLANGRGAIDWQP